VREFVLDVLSTEKACGRPLVDNRMVLQQLDSEPRFGRKIWGLLSLELWQRAYHDRAASFRKHAEPVIA
jgi:asparagine synthase (glutamine-hydrolysing)